MHRAKKLYHFTTIENAIRYILPFCKLKMNALWKMNDPNENLKHIIDFHQYSDNQLKIGEISEIIEAKLMCNDTRIISFSTDKNNGNKGTIKGYKFQRMWAQYGSNHTGICIVIDYEKFKIENSKVIEDYKIIDDYVLYNNDFCVPPSFTPLIGKKFGSKTPDSFSLHNEWEKCKLKQDYLKQHFFTKNKDWEGESEYRFLTVIDEDSEEIQLSFKNSLDKIILGLNFSKYYIPSLESLIEKSKIEKLMFDRGHRDFKLLSER